MADSTAQVWISPVTYNLPGYTANGEAYHGYWQQNLYELNPHFGTAGDLKALSEALHKRGMVGFDNKLAGTSQTQATNHIS